MIFGRKGKLFNFGRIVCFSVYRGKVYDDFAKSVILVIFDLKDRLLVLVLLGGAVDMHLLAFCVEKRFPEFIKFLLLIYSKTILAADALHLYFAF